MSYSDNLIIAITITTVVSVSVNNVEKRFSDDVTILITVQVLLSC